MKTLFAAMVLTFSALVVGGLGAGDKKDKAGKEVTLTGKICCAKCELGVAKACATVIVVTKDKKDVVYYFDPAGHKKYHGPICTTPMDGTVTGTVATAGKKNTVTVKTVEFKK